MQTRYTSADQWADAKDGVIPAPYALEEGEQIIDQYLEPVIFHNVNGPDIGVTTCGVIVKDGLYFKDLDNSGELAPYKDWQLSPEQRAEDNGQASAVGSAGRPCAEHPVQQPCGAHPCRGY